MNKILYITLAIICVVVALGVVISRIVTQSAFEVQDLMLLITTVAGWIFAKGDEKNKTDTKEEHPEDDVKSDVDKKE